MNFQNIPRDNLVVKRAIVPKLDVLIEWDYDSIEMRLLGYFLARQLDDWTLVNEIVGGLDPHVETAKRMLNVETPTPKQRETAKRLNYSIVYGGGQRTLVEQLGITYPQARELLKKYHRAQPGIKDLQDIIAGRYEDRGYITTFWGRHLHPPEERLCINTLVQGAAADLMKASLVKIDRWARNANLRSHLVLTVHDSAMLDLEAKDVVDAIEAVPELMREPRFERVIPITVEPKVFPENWATPVRYEQWRDEWLIETTSS